MMRNNKQRTYFKHLESNAFEERGDDAKHIAKGSLQIPNGLITTLGAIWIKEALEEQIQEAWSKRKYQIFHPMMLKTSLAQYELKDELDNIIWAQRREFKGLGSRPTHMKTHLGLNNHILGLISCMYFGFQFCANFIKFGLMYLKSISILKQFKSALLF